METVDEALKKGLRLCRVWNNPSDIREIVILTRTHCYLNFKQYIDIHGRGWNYASLLGYDDIAIFLGGRSE